MSPHPTTAAPGFYRGSGLVLRPLADIGAVRKAVNLRRGHFPGQWLNVDNLAASYWLT